ncbi:MAG: chloride channel protein [Planctomycetota bacterium]|nr:chloride channel protein [Planctomycetota bacterium]
MPGPDWEGVIVGALIGLAVGALALAYMVPITWLEHKTQALGMSGEAGFAMMLAAPIVGALGSGLIFALIASPIQAHGIGQIIWAVNRLQSRIPASLGIKQWIGSTCTIGSGGSAGPEGPIVSVGAAVGSQVAHFLRVDTMQRTTLLGCGAAAGLAAVFNAPLTGVFFVLEVLLRDFSLRMMAPIVVASVMGAATAQALRASNEPIFGVGPSQFDGFFFELDEIPSMVILGVVVGLCGGWFVRMLEQSARLFARLKVPALVRPAVGALLLAGLGWLWCTAHDSHAFPPFFGNGYSTISAWCSSERTEIRDGQEAWPIVRMLTLLLAAKAVATCLTIGSGACGGLFAPSLVLGAVSGALCGVFLNAYTPLPDVNPVLCAVIGMAAFVAGGSHAPLTGVMLAYEITRNYSVMLPLLMVTVLSTLFSRLVSTHSVYTGEIDRLGLKLGSSIDMSVLRRVRVGDLFVQEAHPISRHATVAELLLNAERTGDWDCIVVDTDGRYVGMVAAPDLRAAFAYREAAPLLYVHELMREQQPLRGDDTLDIAFEAFSATDAQSLPIVDRRSNIPRGLISRQQVMKAYQKALAQA